MSGGGNPMASLAAHSAYAQQPLPAGAGAQGGGNGSQDDLLYASKSPVAVNADLKDALPTFALASAEQQQQKSTPHIYHVPGSASVPPQVLFAPETPERERVRVSRAFSLSWAFTKGYTCTEQANTAVRAACMHVQTICAQMKTKGCAFASKAYSAADN